MCGLTHTSSHTGGNFSSHPTFLIIVEPKQHKELVVTGFLGCKPRSSAVRWGSSYAYVATKQLNGTGVTEELNFSLYLIHLNVHTHTSNSARLFGLGHVGPRAGTSPLRCRRGEQVGSVGVCEAGPMAAMLTAEMSESGEGDEMCLRRCGGVQVVKQVFGEVSKEVLSRYVGFFHSLQEAVMEDPGTVRSPRKTEKGWRERERRASQDSGQTCSQPWLISTAGLSELQSTEEEGAWPE